ncbi:MAG TPA: potassium-transporting ATPase subunit KdpA [Actinomycetota bacterium]
MSATNWLEIGALLVLLAISTPLLGGYMAKVYGGGKAPGDRFFLPIERAVYRVCGIDPEGEQRWSIYVLSLLLFTLVGIVFTYVILRIQAHLPLNPDHQKAVAPGLSFNTAISFGTNTNWQNYSGESTLSHLSQMLGLVWHQYISAAVGMALAVAFMRGLIRRRGTTLGSFWVDTVRSTTRVLIPISFVFAVFLMSQGAIQNFHASTTVNAVAVQSVDAKGNPVSTQSVPGGPVSSMVPIEGLGDNGGGFFNANGAHPFELPNPVSSLLYVWILSMIAFAFPWTYGKLIGSMRQGIVVLTAMSVLFLVGLLALSYYEGKGNPKLAVAGVSQSATASHPGGNLEGKDLRLGVGLSALNANAITSSSTGTTNAAHESFVPLGGSIPLYQIMLGEVDPGGTGTGLYGMLIMVFISVFVAGLMVGRTPEYLGKKIQSTEIKLTAVYVLVLPFCVLTFAAVSMVTSGALKSVLASGPHGLTEVVYAYASMAHNNGSAFAGLTGNTRWFNATGGVDMLIGRFALIIPAIAIAGSLVRKRPVAETVGTLRTDTPLFTGMLIVVTVVLTGLQYFPTIALGPFAEHFSGRF